MSRFDEIYRQQQHAEDRKRKAGPQIQLCGLPVGGYAKHYTTVLSVHETPAQAVATGSCSGLAAWEGAEATRAGYPPEGRLGRLWVEAKGFPATRGKS